MLFVQKNENLGDSGKERGPEMCMNWIVKDNENREGVPEGTE